MSVAQVDLLIVGGGINGAGIARDAAGRGLTVMLVEKDDLAAHTSSASSKLIHGGLRYLEQFDLKLVRESLQERERLLRVAPHIVRPLQFVLPLTEASRPSWMIRSGLFLYDHLAMRELLPASRSIRLVGAIANGLKASGKKAFTYWDCRVQDSRLVVLNALDAAARGATIRTRTELIEARREEGMWTAKLGGTGAPRTVRARALLNAAGPWASEILNRLGGVQKRRAVRLVKGSHIVLPRLYPGSHAYLLQNPDRRIVFAIPFEGRFTLVGTTEVSWAELFKTPAISDDEVAYLLRTVARNFVADVSSGDIVWSYSGVRTLPDDGSVNPSRITRDYVLDLDTANGEPPLLSIFGGKITTYRRLAERALEKLAPLLGFREVAWTDGAILPGGDIPELDPDGYAGKLIRRHPGLPDALVARLAGTYGTLTEELLESGLGEDLGGGLHTGEVDYLVSNEWAQIAEDILFRRTKLGLQVPEDTADRLTAYLGR